MEGGGGAIYGVYDGDGIKIFQRELVLYVRNKYPTQNSDFKYRFIIFVLDCVYCELTMQYIDLLSSSD